MGAVLARAVSARVYHLPSVDPSNGTPCAKNQLTPDPIVKQLEARALAWTGVPVLEVQDVQGRAYALALEVFAA